MASEKPKRPPITEHPDLLEMDLDEKFDKIKHRKELTEAAKQGAYIGLFCSAVVIGIVKRRHKKERDRVARPPAV